MGVGRRMKKQGPPEPLSEAHFAKLKRKAGLPVDVPTEDAPNNKRRRRSSQAATAASTTTSLPARTSNGTPAKPKANGKLNGAKKPATAIATPKFAKSRKREAEPTSDDEMSDGLGEGFGDSDLEEGDEFSGLEEDEDEAGLGAEDFLGSDDDSVYDSDDPQNDKRAMFSEDEDDSDAEEKLTAANIAGLSRRLDEQQAREDAEAQAELEEAALQTNIEDVQRPHILADGEEEVDDLALKTKGLLAPDLQLLRSRINETIRVLDDMKLAEEGRSRADYTTQLLKDICAYCKQASNILSQHFPLPFRCLCRKWFSFNYYYYELLSQQLEGMSD